MEEFVPCGECTDGYIFEDTPEGVVVKKCQCLIDWLDQKKMAIAFQKAGLSESDLDYSIDQYIGKDRQKNIPKIKQYVNEFQKRYRHINLYFWSYENSTQKTTVAKWMLAELARKGYRTHFVLFNDLVVLLQQYNFDQSREVEYQRAMEADLLVVDDAFDTNKNTIYKSGFQYSFIDTFFRKRLEIRRGATVFTSNVPVEDIEKSYTPSIQALIDRNIAEPFFFEDAVENGRAVGGFGGKDLFAEIDNVEGVED